MVSCLLFTSSVLGSAGTRADTNPALPVQDPQDAEQAMFGRGGR